MARSWPAFNRGDDTEMGAQVKHRQWYFRYVAVVAGMTALVVTASASSLGTINSADIFAWGQNDTVDLPHAFDHFDDCAGNLNNDVDVVGNPWLAPSTDWRCQSVNSRARNRNELTLADSATVDVGLSNQISVSTFVERTSRLAGGAGSGVSLFHDGSTFHMYVVYQRGSDQITIGRVDGSGDTEIASFGWLPRSGTIEFLVEIDQPDITIYADGLLITTYTMSAGELATFSTNTRFGLESDFDRRSRWSWFQVEVLVP